MELSGIDLRPSCGEPLYFQLYKSIVRQITSGELECGQKLPSKRALSVQLSLSVNTVDGAYQMLVAEGYIEARPRSGFYVCQLDRLPEAPPEPRISRARPAGEEKWLYDFQTGGVDPGLFPYKTWARTQREILTEHPDYLNLGDRQGDYPLRLCIAEHLHSYRGVRCTPDQLVIGAGIEYLIGLLACLFRDRVFGLENPGYTRIHRVLENNGVKSVAIPVDQNGLRAEELESCSASILYVTPSHQFPTGAILPMARRQALLSWAASGRRYIIEDDYDSEFRFDTRPIPALQGLDRDGRVIYIGTFSRIIAPSIRIAFMVLPESLCTPFLERFSAYSPTVSRFEQHTLRRFMQSGAFVRHLNRVRIAYRSRRDLLVRSLYEQFGRSRLTIQGAHTGLHLLVRLDGPLTEREMIQAAAGQGIRVRGLSEYYLANAQDCPPSTVVLGYSSLSEEALPEACALLARGWGRP